ncbi:hypothetical protein Sjap_021434 [Stephania japonica]|uniref:Uncharacterized protein n=1 Tax=Stephania japonica TaxID=461633 RepID=A0AAP0HSV1_9MAGN
MGGPKAHQKLSKHLVHTKAMERQRRISTTMKTLTRIAMIYGNKKKKAKVSITRHSFWGAQQMSSIEAQEGSILVVISTQKQLLKHKLNYIEPYTTRLQGLEMCWKTNTKKAEPPRGDGKDGMHRSSHMLSLPCFTIQPKPYRPDSEEDETYKHGQKEAKPKLHSSAENTQSSLLYDKEDNAFDKEKVKKTTASEKGASQSSSANLEKQDAITSSPMKQNAMAQNQSSPPSGVKLSDGNATKTKQDQVEPQEFPPSNNRESQTS